MPRKKGKKKKTTGKIGRPRVNHEFDHAVRLVRGENIQSFREYQQWYKLHAPAKIPKRPDRAYKKEWKGWGHFLGNYNEIPCRTRKKFRPYEDAKAFARTLGYTSVEQWHAFAKTDKKPDDIPARPDVHYQKSGEWFTWTEFLGTRIHHKIEYAQKAKKYLYIGRYPDVPFTNIFVLGIDTSIYNLVHDADFTLLKLYEYEEDLDWVELVERHGKKYYDKGRSNEYLVERPGSLFSELSISLSEVFDINV